MPARPPSPGLPPTALFFLNKLEKTNQSIQTIRLRTGKTQPPGPERPPGDMHKRAASLILPRAAGNTPSAGRGTRLPLPMG